MASRLASLAVLWVVAACGDHLGPKIEPCRATDGFPLTLVVTGYFAVNPTADSACVRFPANAGPDTVEYLLVSQLTTGTPGRTTGFNLLGNDIVASLGTAAQLLASGSEAGPTPAEAFHLFLRRSEQARVYGSQAPGPVEGPRVPATAPLPAPPTLNSQRSFKVCAKIDCSAFAPVTATAKFVKAPLAIYVDDASPAGGLDSAEIDTVGNLFINQLYPLDKTAFGNESDIDANSMVLVLMTPVVNKMVTKQQCDTAGYIAGFFFSFDIDPVYATNPNSNRAEIFYSLVADPVPTLPSCAHTALEVKRLVPVTFIHEFQHMISFNEHVLNRGGNSEVLWLNEGLSHFAEEMGGRSFAPGDPRRAPFFAGDWFNAYKYLDDPESTILVTTTGVGSLAERGVEWLFVRYLVEQFGAGLTRKLDQTNLTGAANVETQTGQSFTRTVTNWALANWVSDLDTVPGFTAPAALRYASEDFRFLYDSLHRARPSTFPKAFPLVPDSSAGATANVSGTLRGGSGVYHRVLQPPGAGAFGIRFISPTGFPLPVSYVPRLSVIRIR